MKKEYIDFYKQIANYNPTNILHVGGHIGQEGEIYKDICPFTFVEPVKKFAVIIKSKGYNVINKAVGATRCKRDFYVQDQISSFLMTKVPHRQVMSSVDVVTLADIQTGYDVLIVDVEGATLEVLKSGILGLFKVIIIEARDDPAFVGEATKKELTDYLESLKFKFVNSYGRDMLFINEV